MTEHLPSKIELTDELRRIAEIYVDADNIIVELLNKAGRAVEKPLDKLPEAAKTAINEVVERALLSVFDTAVKAHLYEEKLNERELVKKLSNMLDSNLFSRNQVVATLSGLAGGVGGFQTALLELPVAIMLIYKEILKVSAEYGRDPESAETRKECLAIFASGTSLETDDYSDSGFIAARLAVRGSTIFELINRFAPQIIKIFGPKFVSPPVIGAAVGAGINYIYIDYFRRISHVQFRINELSKQFDPVHVHDEFKTQVGLLRKQRKLTK